MTITLTIEGWIALLTIFVSAIGGGAWSMATLHSNVRAIRTSLSGWRNEDRREKEVIWNKLNAHTKLVNNHAMSLQNHNSRIESLERQSH